jgi:hypothetical protein
MTIAITVVVSGVLAVGPAIAAVRTINATKLNGYKANQLIRVAESHINNNAVVGPATNAVARSVTIYAPKNGYLVMTASSDVYGSPDTDTCELRLDGTITLSASDTESNCGTDSAWPVAKGTHTVDFVATNPAAGVIYDETTLEVMFVPFDAYGSVPIPVAPSAPSAADSGANN